MVTQEKNSSKRIVVIDIAGPLNSTTAQHFEKKLADLLAQGKRYFIFDATPLEYISSHGIGTLLTLTKMIEERNGKSVIIGLNSEIDSLMRVLGISPHITTLKSRQEALTWFKKKLSATHNNAAIDRIPGNKNNSSAFSTPDADFHSPLIIDCSFCDTLIRVYRPGKYICPGCEAHFSVDNNGSALFQQY